MSNINEIKEIFDYMKSELKNEILDMKYDLQKITNNMVEVANSISEVQLQIQKELREHDNRINELEKSQLKNEIRLLKLENKNLKDE